MLASWVITYLYVKCKLYALQLMINVTSLAGRYAYGTFKFSTKGNLLLGSGDVGWHKYFTKHWATHALQSNHFGAFLYFHTSIFY